MRDQPVAGKRNPFARVGTRFIGEPFDFGSPVIKWLRRFPTQRTIPIFHGHTDSLVLRQGKGFQRAQYAMLVNGLKVYRYDTSVISARAS
jgi:hypothetical protein